MIEIQCTSCQTRYRIDEHSLPDDTPTFRCSRCGHVFATDPRQNKVKGAESPRRSSPLKGPGPTSIDSESAADDSESATLTKPRRPIAPARLVPAQSAASTSPEARASQSESKPDKVSAGGDPSPDVFQPKQPDAGPVRRPSSIESRSPAANVAGSGVPRSPKVIRYPDRELRSRLPDRRDDRLGLSFDFSDEPSRPEVDERAHVTPAARAGSEQWKVGDLEQQFVGPDDEATGPTQMSDSEVRPRFRIADPESETLPPHDFFPDEVRYFVPATKKIHHAGFFVGLFAMVTLGFGLLSLVMCGAPKASASFVATLPAIGDRFKVAPTAGELVKIDQVRADYNRMKGGELALVVSGRARNAGADSLRKIQVFAALFDEAGGELATRTVYCGNELSRRTIGEMTARELDFYQQLEPAKNFALEPSKSVPFLLVFVNPPAHAASFGMAVVEADSPVAEKPVGPAS